MGFFVFCVIVGGIALIVWMSIMALDSSSAPAPPEKTADEYNAEAVLMAARKNHLDMKTELRKSEIEAARIEALHKEREEIIAHDRKLRELNAELDVKRSS